MRTSNSELRSWMENFSSIKKILQTQRGEVILWKDRVIKDKSGNPVPLDYYLRVTGERRMVTKPNLEPNTERERTILKACKSDYKKSMKRLFGDNWKVLSRKHRIYNVPSDELLIQQIAESIK